MQYKLYKRSTILLGIVLIIDVVSIIWMFVNAEYWKQFGYEFIIGFVALLFLLMFIFSYIDLNADRNMIRKAVRNGNVALARIKSGTFFKIIRDARIKTQVLWKLDLDVYDQDMNIIPATTIEKISPYQKSIPQGYVFVTYNPDKPEEILVIPNIIISSIPEYAPLVQEYEKHFKPTYLNAYYNKAMYIKTFKESIKEDKEYRNMK